MSPWPGRCIDFRVPVNSSISFFTVINRNSGLLFRVIWSRCPDLGCSTIEGVHINMQCRCFARTTDRCITLPLHPDYWSTWNMRLVCGHRPAWQFLPIQSGTRPEHFCRLPFSSSKIIFYQILLNHKPVMTQSIHSHVFATTLISL